jgi:uncharacterized repeat protein (TIGR01451 family)
MGDRMLFRHLLVATAMATLVACGGSSNGETRGDSTVSVANPPRAATSGGNVQFTVAVANNSSGVMRNITVDISLGTGLQLNQVTCAEGFGLSCPTSTTSMTVASMQPGAVLQLLVSAQVASGFRGAIDNSVSLTAPGDSDHGNNLVQFRIEVYSADVSVTTAPSAAEYFSGGTATYVMSVTNSGPDTVTDLVAQNTLSSGQSLVGITCGATGGAVCPAVLAATTQVPPLPAGGTLAFTVTAAIAADTIGAIANTLYASAAGDSITFNNVATASATTRVPVSATTPSFIILQSDAGDYVGAGKRYSYNRANAQLQLLGSGSAVHFSVAGDQSWTSDLRLPGNLATLQPGTYPGVPRLPDGTSGNFYWVGEGRGCNSSLSTLIVDGATYVAGVLTVLDLRFEQHCEGGGAALRGQLHWNANDATLPAGPINPPPAGLWAPAAGAVPASGNYVYLQSDTGDFIGAGRTMTYTQANAQLQLTLNNGLLQVTVNGDDNWSGQFAAMTAIATLQPGYYPDLRRYPFHNTTRGGLSWSGEGRGCNTLTGWFAVDSISFLGGAVSSIDLRFEQHCEGGAAALRGRIHWSSGDTTQPPGPQQPPPANLWAPPAGATPATGNYIYLQSDTGDYIGQGRTALYLPTNSVLSVTASGARVQVGINGSQDWGGEFVGMNTLAALQPGYYGNLQRYPFHNPVLGGLSWSGEGRGCNTLTGWFVVDSITYAGNTLASIDLRFEQHCEGGAAALRGKIHWSSGDTTQPPGPQQPPPANLWAPPAGATPATGNYIYLQSDTGDYIGQGRTELYLPATSSLSLTANGAGLQVGISGSRNWGGNFVAMNSLTRLEPGYYGNLQRYPFHNPALGGMSWSGEGRGCNTLTGWFVIDSITYSGNALASIDLRFEQHCEGGAAALRGKIHWVAGG